MFGTLAICYLFFGGVGAGTLFVTSLVDLVWVREPFGCQVDGPSSQAVEPVRRLLSVAVLVGFCGVVFGILCLAFDLGRPDRLETLFLNPSVTFLTLGSFALAVLALIGGFLTIVRFCSLPNVPRGVVIAAEIIAALLAAIVMVYAGMMLQSFSSVALWDTPLVPLLFVLSSLSAGCAILFVVAFAVEAGTDVRALRVLGNLVRFDAVVIALEAVGAIAFVVLAFGDERASAVEAVRMLVLGDGWLATLWWAGFVACGIAVPLLLEAALLFFRNKKHHDTITVCALVGVFVLVGALGLRFSLAEAGMHRTLELEAVLTTDATSVILPNALESGMNSEVTACILDYEWSR